ncbi:sensor histidine kinase [Pontimicrobium sp. IMCC45349]|uniref:sensor histidine kinase n=1 Tax=Pontimicrobium sp. IMCC45349 TaxID=3391574 RepID=UPI0039A38AA6
MDYFGLIILPKERTYEIFIYAFIWGTIIALPFHNLGYLKKKRKVVFRVYVLMILFLITIIIDSNMKVPDNPITFFLLMGFWLGLAYLLSPVFIKKYWKLIALIYIPLFLYFMYLRLFSGDLDSYLKIKESFPFYIFFLPIPMFALLWTYQQWKWFQNLKAEKSQAELAMLQAQVNPHFFFNTLNNLYALTIKNSNKAPEVILKLSDMMRYTIYEGKKGYVSIKEEIDYLNNYIELHKIRYKKEVDIQFNHTIENDIKTPPLLFIILLENAFKHGVESLSENAYIHINLLVKNGFIQFQIENNFELQSSDENGIGLENLQRRLHLLFDKNYTLTNETKDNIYKSTLKIPIDA